jgi:hypothetical protein
VGAWFAVYEPASFTPRNQTWREAALWILNPGLLNRKTIGDDIIPVLSQENLTTREERTDREAGDDQPRKQPELGDLLTRLVEPMFHEDMSYISAALAVMPPELDLRMLLQQSVFTIHGDPSPLEDVDGAQDFLLKLVIPGEMRTPLHRDLHDLGVRHSALFADLDHLAAQLQDDQTWARLRAVYGTAGAEQEKDEGKAENEDRTGPS